VRLLSTLSTPPRHLLQLAGMSLVLVAGCMRPLYTIEAVVSARSCVNDARGIRFLVDAGVSSVTWEGGSANIVGAPTLTVLGTGLLEVSAELDSVPSGDEVTLRFTLLGFFPATGQVSEIGFFTVPPPGLPEVPDCMPGETPIFALFNDVQTGLKLQVSNPGPQPMTLVSLELAEVPGVLPGPMLDWSNSGFNALPWQTAVPGGTPLDSQAPPLVIDLPDQVAHTTNATLLRFISLVAGEEFRGIVQVDLNGTVAVESKTWGGVKSRYRN
jgi:hypothetical protein